MIALLTNHASAGAVPIERLNGSTRLNESEKIAEAARQFEAMLLRQILSESQKPLLHATAAEKSTAATIYRDMISNQLADSIAQSGSLGLARSLQKELDREAHSTTAAHPSPPTLLPVPNDHSSLRNHNLSAPANPDSGPSLTSFRPDRS